MILFISHKILPILGFVWEISILSFISLNGKALLRLVSDISDFSDCLLSCALADIPFTGQSYTWSNRQENKDRVWSKLDRILGNCSFMQAFPNASAKFHFDSTSDHYPTIFYSDRLSPRRIMPFKFLNPWYLDDRFMSIVANVWKTEIHGCRMFILVSKLKLLKGKLKRWHGANYSFLQTRISCVEKKLASVTVALQVPNAPSDFYLQERSRLSQLRPLKQAYYSNLQQRSKLEFIRCNDESCKYFFAKISERRAATTLHSITDSNGILHESPTSVADSFVKFYRDLLGPHHGNASQFDFSQLEGPSFLP